MLWNDTRHFNLQKLAQFLTRPAVGVLYFENVFMTTARREELQRYLVNDYYDYFAEGIAEIQQRHRLKYENGFWEVTGALPELNEE